MEMLALQDHLEGPDQLDRLDDKETQVTMEHKVSTDLLVLREQRDLLGELERPVYQGVSDSKVLRECRVCMEHLETRDLVVTLDTLDLVEQQDSLDLQVIRVPLDWLAIRAIWDPRAPRDTRALPVARVR